MKFGLRLVLLSLLLSLTFLSGYTQANNLPPDDVNTASYYPFRIDEKAFTAIVNITDPKIDGLYNELFRKYGYTGNAHTWESLVYELISENDVDFSIDNDLDITPGLQTLTIKANNIAELRRALNAIQPTFAVITKLEAFVKAVLPAHIQDGHTTPPNQ